jgi:hypothetical protein
MESNPQVLALAENQIGIIPKPVHVNNHEKDTSDGHEKGTTSNLNLFIKLSKMALGSMIDRRR